MVLVTRDHVIPSQCCSPSLACAMRGLAWQGGQPGLAINTDKNATNLYLPHACIFQLRSSHLLNASTF